jgi:hypothetical protein
VVARAAGLVAVAVLPLLAGITGGAALQPHHFASGFHTAVMIAGFTCAAGGLLAAATIRNPPGAATLRHRRRGTYACALGAPSLVPDEATRAPGAAPAS